MALLEVEGLTKHYPGFTLDHVSFRVQEGTIMGLIGRNGAGKSTTLKSLLGLVHPEAGQVRMFDCDFPENQIQCRHQLGVVFGEADFYLSKHLKDIAAVTRRFYPAWDQNAYEGYLKRFALEPGKRIKELSTGMRVKFSLALALSHGARLLLLDEPTSGLDPVSRDELLDIFLDITADGQHGILFSTHIISDLERCADEITYLQRGRVLDSRDREAFADGWRLVSGAQEDLTPELRPLLRGCRRHAYGFEALISREDAARYPGLEVHRAGLEEIMLHLEREEQE